MRSFKRGIEWPNEGFVQGAIEAFFLSSGFEVEKHKTIDLVCSHPVTRVKWRVEAKGLTTAVGLDFRTGLGQLLQGMNEKGIHYGLAVPDILQFRKQVEAVPSWVTETLGINWLYVSEDSSVKVVPSRFIRSIDTDAQRLSPASPLHSPPVTCHHPASQG
jgi:hypothetical protein